jgi:uncharacterized protein
MDWTSDYPLNEDPGDRELTVILTRARTIAVVGLSSNPRRDSHDVASYLQNQGFRIIPVNPNVTSALGERAYPDLAAIPADVDVDIVDVFRRPDAVASVVDTTAARGVGTLWLQLGVSRPDVVARAKRAGLTVIAGRCIKVEHSRLLGPPA